MSAKPKKLLRIYLRDHDFVLRISQQVALRSARANRDNELGDLLIRLHDEFRRDYQSLDEVMTLLGVSPNRIKRASPWIAEKFGRMKLNGRWISYSPLSRAYESLALTILIGMKETLWKSLKENYPDKLGSIDIDRLIDRASQQLDELKPHFSTALGQAIRSD